MRKANIADYIRLQGGRPKLFLASDGLWHIEHAYLPGQPVVRIHRPPQHDRVTLEFAGELVSFDSSLLWQFEGAPCELSSTVLGGKGYLRLNLSAPFLS